nr:tape measure protein [uncultured Bacteroides sp.]
MAGLHFDITGDNSNLLHKLEESRNGIRSTSKQIEDSGMSIEQMFGRMTTAAAAFGVSLGAKQLVSDITRVRGEFQQLEVAFNTMLGSKEQADTLMSQLVKTAAITPFDLQGVANGAKQLLAYGTAAEDVNGTLVRLGDIAAGLSIPLNDLVWLYGTTMTQGRLFTQDLRQFQGRGIPLADELAKQFGVAKDKVSELVTAGKVGFPEVQKAIEAMTNDGGKFGGLMEAQSKTITGQISNIEDAISTMFNQIGKENESVINGSLSSVSYLVEHWQEVAIAIESAAVAYGTYKAAVMATAALQDAEQTLKVDTEIEGLKSLLAVKEESNNADIAAAVASGRLTESKAAELTMLREELALKISSLQAQNALAEKEYANALLNATAAEKRLQSAQDAVDGMDDWIARAEDLGNTELANTYRTQLAEKSTELHSAAIASNSAQKALNDAATKKKSTSEALNIVTVQANTVANHANTASMNIMKLAAIQLTTILKGMWVTLMANPLFLVMGAFAGLTFAVYKVATAESEAEKATRLYNEAIDEQQKKQDEYKEKIDKLVKAIDDSTKSEGERLRAFEALKAEYPTVLNNLLTEAEYLKDILKYKKLIAEEDNNRAKKSDAEILEEEVKKLHSLQRRVQNFRKQHPGISDDSWRWGGTMDEYNAQIDIVNKQKAKVASHDVASFLGNIKDMKNEDIVSVIDGINNSLKALDKSSDDTIAIVTELGGEFSKQQLSSIKNALETEQKARSTEKYTGKEWIEKYKNSYLAAKKELDDFLNTNNSLTEIEYERKLKELTDKKDEAEKKYKSVGGMTGSSLSNQAESIRQQQEKYALLLDKQVLDRKRQAEDLEKQLSQSKIDAMSDGFEKEQAQRELNNEKEIQELERRKQDYIRSYIQAEKEKFDAEEELKAKQTKGYKKRTFNSSGVAVDTSKHDKIIENTKTKQVLNEWEQREASMNEYLLKYGTFSQKKEAIDKKYRDAIDKEIDLGKKNILQKEWEESISSLNMDKLKQEINWELVFGDLSKVSKKSLEQVKKQLKEFKNSDEYKNMSVDQKKVIDESLNNIQSTIIDKGGLLGDLPEQLDALRIAQDELKKAQDEYNDAVKNGTDAEKEAALKKKNNAEKNVQNAETNVTKSADKTKQNLITLADTITQLGSSSEMSLSQIGNLASGIVDIFTETESKIGGIVGAIFSVLEGVQKQGLDGFVSNILGNVAGAIGGILDTLTFGAFGLGGADYSHYNDMKAKYETLSSVWDELIDKKKEYIDISYGSEALKAGQEALDIIDKSQQAQRNLARARASSGASAGSHSIAYRQNKGLGGYAPELYKYVSQNGNYNDITSALLGASEEQLKKVREQMPEMWAGLDGDFREHLDNIISGAEQTKEVLERMKEAVTGMSFDEFRSGYVDLLSDLDSTNEDFADNFEKYLQNAIFESLLANKYKDQIQDLYDTWSEYGKDGLSSDEAQKLRDMQKQLTESMIAERDKLMADFGWESDSESSRKASQKGIATASQDSVDENNGRLAVMQAHTSSINENVNRMVSGIDSIANHTANLSCLTNIDKTMQSLIAMRDTSLTHLSDISNYTSNLVEMKQFMYSMKQDINAILIKGTKIRRD